MYEDNHEHHRDAHHPRTDKRAYIRTVRSVHSPRPLTPEPVHAAHTDDGHRKRPLHGNNTYARLAGPHQSPTLAPIDHVWQTLQSTPTRTPHSTNLNGHTISPGPRDTDNKHPSRTPIYLPDIRGRALCSKRHGENDDAFHFYQWCTAPSTYGSKDSDTALLCIDESAINQQFVQFTKAVANKPPTRHRDAASLLFECFSQSRVAGSTALMTTTNSAA